MGVGILQPGVPSHHHVLVLLLTFLFFLPIHKARIVGHKTLKPSTFKAIKPKANVGLEELKQDVLQPTMFVWTRTEGGSKEETPPTRTLSWWVRLDLELEVWHINWCHFFYY